MSPFLPFLPPPFAPFRAASAHFLPHSWTCPSGGGYGCVRTLDCPASLTRETAATARGVVK
eukprot:6089321-Heterocapsa_arctica.AAC.1